jgi:hypothetical protein
VQFLIPRPELLHTNPSFPSQYDNSTPHYHISMSNLLMQA